VSEPSQYDQGVTAGRIESRLAGHDKHFEAINGSIGKVASELHDIRLTVQRLADQAVSRDATVITTAAALRDAEEARRRQADQRWSPWQKSFAVLAAIGVVVGLYFALRG
jgi:ElaB/YqjD/DUF883 family membrane-anchored ribosome-binding protein